MRSFYVKNPEKKVENQQKLRKFLKASEQGTNKTKFRIYSQYLYPSTTI